MLHFRSTFLFAVVVAVAALAFTSGMPAGTALAQQSRGGHAWEYAQLVTNYRQSRPAAWTTPERTIAGDDLDELFRELSGGKSRERVTAVDLLNLVGRDGWELVSHSGMDGGTQTWLLKRPAER